ncbi:hypothetical protein ACFE04_010976 [Oxalis oulophora]
MESNSKTVDFLQGKTILVTGVTGFLGKLFIEKILRVQCNIKKLYLLIRADDSITCSERLHHEDVFNTLRDKMGKAFNSFITEKVVAVPGDISKENLGIEDYKLREEMWKEIKIIVNVAATTDFDERYDISFDINTLGALNVLNFAKKCLHTKILLHVSTAFVGDLREEILMEKPFYMGQTLSKTNKLDIDMEKKVIENKLNDLRQQRTSKEEIKRAMKNLGIERGMLYGWSNTYVFTKAMGEMLLNQFKDENMALVIIRPTIVLSTYKEPFPGWIEGLKTIDSTLVSYGKGRITCFLGTNDSIFDAIPADMVVNSMMVAMEAHTTELSKSTIYHVGSSSINILKLRTCHDCAYHYFSQNPLKDKKSGKSIKIKKGILLSTTSEFSNYIYSHYGLPLKALRLANAIFCQKFRDAYYKDLDFKIKVVMQLVELYKPFLLLKTIFDDTNTENLRMIAKESNPMNMEDFKFDPTDIDWEDYFINIHFPGIVKHVVSKKR